MDFPHTLHHGAVSGVIGSCHQLLMDAANSLLVDCGLFQAAETSVDGKVGAGRHNIDFSLDGIKALVAAHVHIDHVGRTSYLLAAGFKGSIICSEPSAKLLPIVLEGAFKQGVSRDQKQVERYLKLLGRRIIALPCKHWYSLVDTPALHARIRLQRAGHILGSAYVQIDLHYPETGLKKRIVFSGDLCPPHVPILPAPKAPYKADVLVIESTYGDRLHENRHTRRQCLEKILEHALSNQGTVLIPTLSIGRTQELLYELEEIIHRKKLNAGGGGRACLPSPSGRGPRGGGKNVVQAQDSSALGLDWSSPLIILDPPLASRFTRVYRGLDHFWDAEALSRLKRARNPLSFRNLIAVDDHRSHLGMVNRLTQTTQPAIVIAGSGMCPSSRIVNCLKAMLGDKRHDVLFVGYQAEGVVGCQIQRFGPRGGFAEIDGQRYDIRAQVHTIGGYSAHADQNGLLGFVTRMRQWSSQVRIVHGEPGAKGQVRDALILRYREKSKCLAQ